MFWGDERHVPPDHAESNFGMALDDNASPCTRSRRRHVHRMRGELRTPHDAAREYEGVLHAGFIAAGRRNQTFDLMLLGMGDDAHIASIFPGSVLLERTAHAPGTTIDGAPLAAAVWAEHLKTWRITLTPPALLDAHAIIVVVSGEHKAEAMQAALETAEDIARWPAQLLRSADERVTWIVDRPASTRLRHIGSSTSPALR